MPTYKALVLIAGLTTAGIFSSSGFARGEPANPEFEAQLVRTLQIGLNILGYYNGPTSGTCDDALVEALNAWAKAEGKEGKASCNDKFFASMDLQKKLGPDIVRRAGWHPLESATVEKVKSKCGPQVANFLSQHIGFGREILARFLELNADQFSQGNAEKKQQMLCAASELKAV